MPSTSTARFAMSSSRARSPSSPRWGGRSPALGAQFGRYFGGVAHSSFFAAARSFAQFSFLSA